MQGLLSVGSLEVPFANSLRRVFVVSMKADRQGRVVGQVEG